MEKLLIGIGLLLSLIHFLIYFAISSLIAIATALADGPSGYGVYTFVIFLLMGFSLFVAWQLAKWMYGKETINKTLLVFLFTLNFLILITPFPAGYFDEKPQSILWAFRYNTGF